NRDGGAASGSDIAGSVDKQTNGGHQSGRCGNRARLRDSRANNFGTSLADVAEGAERKICAQDGGSNLGPSHRCQIAGGDAENLAAVMQVLYQFTDEGAELWKKLLGARRKFALQKLQSARQQPVKAARFPRALDGRAQN